MPVLRTRRRTGARARRAGFSLVEMMISLVIIAVMAMIIAPSLGEMQQSSRQTASSMDLVRLGRSIRAQTIATGVAHLLEFSGGPNGVGLIQVHMGMNNSCLQTPWRQTYEVNALKPRPSADYDMGVYNPAPLGAPVRVSDTSRPVIRLEATVGGTARQGLLLCYQPNGEIYYNELGSDAAASEALRRQDLPVTFQVVRRFKSTVLGRTRAVIFPPGGSARAL